MLTTSSRLRIQTILIKLSKGEEVTLPERIYINKFADRDQTVSAWLSKAKQLQNKKSTLDSLDNLITDLGIGSHDHDNIYNPDQEDLGDWFSGAPSWLGRS
tara:strand:+ start:4908 stop:5210 length:303 start_codon:yes stop_codon:yes gene_type:complete